MAKHLPSVVWSLRWPPKKKPNGVVRTMTSNQVGIAIEHQDNVVDQIIMDRRTARLLAKRINECLDYTKAK